MANRRSAGQMDRAPASEQLQIPGMRQGGRGSGWWTMLTCPRCGAQEYGPQGNTICSLGHAEAQMIVPLRDRRIPWRD